MKKSRARHYLLSAFALILFSATRLFAFHSTQKQSVAAGAFVGSPAPVALGLKIHHDQLPAGSLVTKQFIIIGEAGAETPIPPPPLSARLNPASNFGPIANRQIRVTITYRFLTQEQFEGFAPAPAGSTLPVVEGPDPTAFAFQIPASSFTAASPILQYRITAERLALNNGQLTVIASTSDPAITPSNPDPWITVNAIANAANTFGREGGRLTIPNGNPLEGESSMDIPAGIFSSPTEVTLNELPSDSTLIMNPYPGGVSYYQATADQPLNGVAQITLLYPDFKFPVGATGFVDGTNIPVQSLTIFVWDGFTWRRLGGVVDTQTDTIRAKIPSFGLFVIAAVQLNAGGTAAQPLSPQDHRPLEKFITPNGDSANRVVTFAVDNLTEDYKIDIYDINGRRVKTIDTGSSLTWDGRDESGRVVESGVYIYQYTIAGKLISGFIAVAK